MTRYYKKSLAVIYGGKMVNKKNGLLIIILFFVINIYLEPVKRFSVSAGELVCPWILPFLLTDTIFLIFFMIIVVCFFTDTLYMNHWNYYYLLRTGRKRWVMEQIGYAIVSAISITGISILLVGISMFKRLKWSIEWGRVLYTLSQTNASKISGLFWKISPQYINKHSPYEAMCVTILTMILGITFLGLFMFWCRLFYSKSLSIVAAITLIVYSCVSVSMGDFMQKKLTMISPISWMRVADFDVVRYGYKIAPSFIYVICAYAILILLLICLFKWKIKNIDFICDDAKE